MLGSLSISDPRPAPNMENHLHIWDICSVTRSVYFNGKLCKILVPLARWDTFRIEAHFHLCLESNSRGD